MQQGQTELRTLLKRSTRTYNKRWARLELEAVEVKRQEDIYLQAVRDGIKRRNPKASSLAYAIGITDEKPRTPPVGLRSYNDRIKPPDVDLDIEDAERPRAVQYLLSLYEARQIGTFSRLGATVNEEGEEAGSIMVTWKSHKRKECNDLAIAAFESGRLSKKGDVGRYGAGIFHKKYGHVESIRDVMQISPAEGKGLTQMNKIGTIYRSYGVHAGGVLLSGRTLSISEYIPTMLVASSDTTVTQFDMDDVEKFGLLKMDVLGQATLRSMKLAAKVIDPTSNPTTFEWIPNDDPAACKEMRNGRANDGVFHFEGYTKAKGGRELGTRSTLDAVLVQALYMPGCMDVAPGMSISQKDLYLERRKSAAARRNITYLHPAFEDALSSTYGAVVFQEQVIQIMRNLGMDIAGINEFFAVVKDSGRGAAERNQVRMAKVRKQFDQLCENEGIDPDEAWKQTASFVTYGFNRAHATGYGIRSYRTAYLKAHFPLEFMAGLLQTWEGRKKESSYIAESRRIGIKILPPDVNVSGLSWTPDPANNAIRKGLMSVAGIGLATAQPIAENAPYTSVADMVERLPKRVMSGGDLYLRTGAMSGTVRKLYDANALSSIVKD